MTVTVTTTALLPPPADLNSPADLAQALVAGDKGLLAIEESIPTRNKRFARPGSTADQPARRAHREPTLTTPRPGDCINGGIRYDRALRQHPGGGVAFLTVPAQAGIAAGINVEHCAKPIAGHPGETVTEGSDRLRHRLGDHARAGARLATWRAVLIVARLPWPIAFCFSRAIEQPALTGSDGQDTNADRAHQPVLARSRSERDARRRDEAPTAAAAVAGPPLTSSGPDQPAPARPVEAHLLRAEGTA